MFEVDGWRFGCALCIEVHFPELFQQYAELDVDCVLFSAYADDPMFGIQAQGYAASHSYWVSVSIPTQMSDGLSEPPDRPDGGGPGGGEAIESRGSSSTCSTSTARDGRSLSIAPSPGGLWLAREEFTASGSCRTRGASRSTSSENDVEAR